MDSSLESASCGVGHRHAAPEHPVAVLVVDDSPAFRDTLVMVLEALRCTVAGSFSLDEAHQAATLPQVDLVFLGLAGAAPPPLGLLRRLCEAGNGQVVVCSAHVTAVDKQCLTLAGAAGALRKPLDLHAVRDVVNFLRWQSGGELPCELLER